MNKKEQPWSDAYSALRDLAENGKVVDSRPSGWQHLPDAYAVMYGKEVENGKLAAAKAAVAWLYSRGLDPTWRPLPRLPGQTTADGWVKQEALAASQILEGMYDRWPCLKGWKVIDRGIVVADSLAVHCEAHDFLAALPPTLQPPLASAEKHLGDLAADLSFWMFTVAPQKNNHPIRVASGLGIAAITLNRHDEYRFWNPTTYWHRPKRWIEKALDHLHPTGKGSALHYQLETGAYAEGTSYYGYATDLALPFFFGYDRFLSGTGVPFLRSDLVNDGARWSVDTRLPDGRRPAIGNSTFSQDATIGFLVAQAGGVGRSDADQSAFLWDWKDAGYPGITGPRAAGLLAALDPSPAVATGSLTNPWKEPTRFLDVQGEAVLRTDAGPDATYALVIAKHGDARTRALGHASVDNGAFTFYSHGDFVTIDPGYAGFTKTALTNKGEDRSLVLVDGKAPRPAHKPLGFLPWVSGGADSFLVPGARTAVSSVRSAEVSSEYEGARLLRTVAAVESRYLLVEDVCRATKGTKRFTTQVETNAGAAKGRPLQVTGAVVHYETYKKQVPVCVGAACDAPLATTVTSGFDHTGDSPEGHDAIHFEASGSSVTFLTAIAANAPGAAAPTVESLPVNGAALRIEAGGSIDIALSNPRGGTVTVAATAGTRAITTDAALAIVSFDATGKARVLEQVGGTTLTVHP